MTEFIHFLATPACIVTFDSEILDVNDLMIKDSKAPSKAKLLTFMTKELCYDKTKHNEIVNTLLSGGEYKNQKVVLKFFDNTLGIRTTNITILSKEKKLLLIQNYGNYDFLGDFIEKHTIIINSFQKLKPFLNNSGKILLGELQNTYFDKINNIKQNALIAHATREILVSHPQLSNNEAFLCALLKLGFTPKEIAYIATYNANQIRVAIHRICKKMNLNTRQNLIEFLRS